MIINNLDYTREIADEEMMEFIHNEILTYSKRNYLTNDQKSQLSQEIFYSLRKLDVLQELLEDESITEIMINGTENIFIEEGGRLYKSDRCFESKEKLREVIQQIVS